jgi:endonuclease III
VSSLPDVLDRLERQYGKLRPVTPADAYGMIVYANCGYPANDSTCAKGFEALKNRVGIEPEQILAASDKELAAVLRFGGIFPELRATRLKEIAARVQRRFDGDLGAALRGSVSEAKKALKQFPTIGEPGAEKILLFTKMAPVAAVPSNCVHVPLRLGFGKARKNYAADYRAAQEAIRTALPEDCSTLLRAYLLLQRHGQELCKRSRPKCDVCPVTMHCLYFQATRSGGL